MGTKCPASYAKIFVGIFEEKFIHPLVNNIARLYLFFNADIFVISTGTLDQLLEFKQRINEVHLSIKSDFKFSNKEINFLDTVVYETPTGNLKLNYIQRIPINSLLYTADQNTKTP